MQVLKEDIRNKIISVAENMFYQNGFKQTSMRQIAKEVGISVSNLYLYYKNKEAIFFAITDGFHRYFLHGFENHLHHEDKKDDINVILTRLIVMDHKKFVILTDQSEGTELCEFKTQLISMLSDHIKNQVANGSSVNKLIVYIMAKNFIEGTIEIAKNYKDEDWLHDSMQAFLLYHFKGLESFM